MRAAPCPAGRSRRWPHLMTAGVGLAVLTGGAATQDTVATWCGLGVMILGLATYSLPRFRRRDGNGHEPLVSLVLLERGSRYLDAAVLACIIDEAWGTNLSASSQEKENTVAGERPTFVVHAPGGTFLVHVYDVPYWENPDEVQACLPEVRAQRAVAEHQAWIAVDALADAGDLPVTRAYQLIGRLVAELARPESLALLHPETGAFRIWDAQVAQLLQGNDPLQCFTEGDAEAVIQVATDDPDMRLAIQEARSRWPEFQAAFAKRHPEQHFSVKGPITRGERTEHIWIEVTAISGEEVRGRLGNDPVDLAGLKLGDAVALPIEAVEDWLYVLTDQPVGGFTIPAVNSARRRARDS